VGEEQYGISRDALYEKMKANNVLGRRYFYPLITDFDPYKNIPSANPTNLPIANKIANQVICLPMHHALSEEEVKMVVECVKGETMRS
jgi:dTDP-4-amino-4,6-dideoxygalactose transaminase